MMDYKLSSQSSIISLADVSVNSISDSELDDEDTVLGSNKSSGVAKSSQSHKSSASEGSENSSHRYNISDFASSSHAKHGQRFEALVPQATTLLDRQTGYTRDDPRDKPLMPLGDVKFALQENHELLSDQTLLKDLLYSIDRKLASNSECLRGSNPHREENLSMFYGPPNKDPGPGSAATSLPVLKEPGIHFNKPAEDGYGSHNSLSNVESHELSADWKINGKHVTFDKGELCASSSQRQTHTGTMTEIPRPHDLLEQLSRLRWRLAGWEEEGLEPPADKDTALIFCHKLLQMLQVTQEQKKHFEKCLATAEGTLKRSQEEAEVLKRLSDKRETRLREADAQIAVVQHQWINAHTASCSETLKLQRDMNKANKERECLMEDLSALENELRKHKELKKDYLNAKSTLEEVQGQFVASRRQTAEIAEENSRLNRRLEEKQKCLQELEEVELVNVKQELEEVTYRHTNLEKSHQKLMRTYAHLSDDIRMLHDQHKTLLQKVVQEEELKEAALKGKEALEGQVKAITSQMSMTKSELHAHYQSQVKELVNQKTETLQGQLVSLESTLKDNLAEQLDAQREAHRHAVGKIQEGHSKEVEDLCNVHSARVSQLQHQMQHLQEENHAMKTQHQGIVTAVSSILTSQVQTKNTRAMLEFPIMASTSTPINTRPVSPQTERVAKGKGSSRNGSRPTSGKSGHNNTRVPCLGRIGSSSSDSDGSVFQDGKQTVRQLVGGSQSNVIKNGSAVKPRALASDPSKMDYGDYEYRSLPDLQNRGENDAYVSPRKASSRKDPASCARKSGSFSGVEMSRPTFRKIYRASEILQNDDEAIGDFPSLSPVNFEMGKLIEELMSIRSSTKTSDSEVPTHDTSFDQDPANITLRKLSQVSTLLSQYVNDAPSSS